MEGTKGRILLAGSDPTFSTVERRMTDAGFRVRRAGNAACVSRVLKREHFDALILDHRLPDNDGLDLCTQLRRHGVDTPLVMLTACESHVERVRCLDNGADDCVGRPFSTAELIARISALLRRLRQHPFTGSAHANASISFGPFHLDLKRRSLKKGDIPLPLTSGDFALLAALARNPGQPMSRDQLMAIVSGREHRPDDRSIDVRIARLRRLLESDTAQPRYLQTVWGLGYVMVPESA